MLLGRIQMKINADITLHVRGQSGMSFAETRPFPRQTRHCYQSRPGPPHLSMTVNLSVNILKQRQIHGSEIKKQPLSIHLTNCLHIFSSPKPQLVKHTP